MPVVPPNLVKGDTILIIATARARNKETIFPAINILESWGLKVETGPNLYSIHHQFAGTDEQRASDLQWAISHKKAKAVLIAGGGYGTLRIIDGIDLKPLKKYPKWVIGYSDTTVLHSRLLKSGFSCIHGTMAFQLNKNKDAAEGLRQLLFGKKVIYALENNALNRAGKCSAEIVGGNLSLIYALSGSKDDIDTKNKILFIEDLDEQLYHIDRMMLQLKRSGKLKKLAGLIVGGMTEMKDNSIPFGKTAEEIILDAVSEYKYPVCFNFPAGHIEVNMPLYLGKKARLEVRAKDIKFKYL